MSVAIGLVPLTVRRGTCDGLNSAWVMGYAGPYGPFATHHAHAVEHSMVTVTEDFQTTMPAILALVGVRFRHFCRIRAADAG